jgi:hypothetical protein
MAIENPQSKPTIFSCLFCNYYTNNKKDFYKHELTRKHKMLINANQNPCKNPQKSKDDKNNICSCGKVYKHLPSLYRHKKTCIPYTTNLHIDEQSIINIDQTKDDMILLLIKENNEFKKIMMEQTNIMMKVIENGTHNTTNNNSHNKSFNLNFFLNETCKDAMNITDFVESIKLQLSDLERVGEIGYVEGISNIIVKNLKGLDVTQRPVHCTDKKRETMYIKDENKWEKDEEQKKMHKMVRKVADKNARMLPKFKEAHPDCIKSTSLYSDQYNKIIMEAMGGKGDNDFEKEEKIIKKVSKEVMVEKESL